MWSIIRVVDCPINTVKELLEDAGRFCSSCHDEHVRGVQSKRGKVDKF